MSFGNMRDMEEREIAAAANWRIAKRRFRLIGYALSLILAAAALSFAYYAGEYAGLVMCKRQADS